VNEPLRSFAKLSPTAMLRYPTELGACAVVLALTSTAALALAGAGPSQAGPSITVSLPPARPVTMLHEPAATDLRSAAEQPQMQDAAMRFAPVEPASAMPFIFRGDDEERSRAVRCMAQAVYYEAGGEPVEGRRAVAQVVLNRVRHPGFPKSVCGVVYQRAPEGTCQFSFVCNGAMARRPQPAAWRTAEMIARAALSGYVEASVGEATNYHAVYVAPAWAPTMTRVAMIGQHIFYRLRGIWGQPSAFTSRDADEAQRAFAPEPSPRVSIIQAVQAKAAAHTPRLTYRIATLLDEPSQTGAVAGQIEASPEPNGAD
jgi:spore germination cell wall hydrolase CwlJ-like protein